jgi:Zn-dependent M28 family amino/carboxypeptidase
MLRFTLLPLIALLAPAQDSSISPSRIREGVKYLSSDLLEGRGVGQRGGALATQYIADQFAKAGAKPAGDNGTYFQKVPLVGIDPQPQTQLGATVKGKSAAAEGKGVDFRWGDDFVGVDLSQQPEQRFEAPAVFVGHGIAAPQFHWDDYKGVDVTGKILIVFTNEPPSNDTEFFDGRALTYYDEEGLRRGARAVIIVHTDDTAGYSWGVVRSSWGRETPYVKLAPREGALGFAGWMSREAGERLFALAGKTVDQMLAASNQPDFKPVDLGAQIRFGTVSKIRDLDTRNVAAVVPGSHPKLKDEAVIFSAHWDHLGIGEPVDGDKIYNGAIDNATGCGVLLELARAWAAMPQKPKRSALFLAVTAEEGGLKGSEYYARHPIFPVARTAIDLNYDAVFPWGRARQIVIDGAERTTALPLAEAIAKRLNLAIEPDAHPEQGHYFRSDHFSFAHAGVPAFSIGVGREFAGKPAGYGDKLADEFDEKHYHQPSDEFQESWDFTALQQPAQFGFLLARDIANQEKLPGWRPGEFHR